MTISELRAWAASAPPGTSIPVASLAELLGGLEDKTNPVIPGPQASPEPVSRTWRERLWTVPAETRLGVHELSEALNRPKSWIYRRTGEKAEDRIPHRKQGGALVFRAGEVRAWLRADEEIIAAGPMESTAAERRLRAM